MSTTFDFQDGKGPVPAHRHINPDKSIGGWVADTARVADTVYVSTAARVFGNIWIFGKARVSVIEPNIALHRAAAAYAKSCEDAINGHDNVVKKEQNNIEWSPHGTATVYYKGKDRKTFVTLPEEAMKVLGHNRPLYPFKVGDLVADTSDICQRALVVTEVYTDQIRAKDIVTKALYIVPTVSLKLLTY